LICFRHISFYAECRIYCVDYNNGKLDSLGFVSIPLEDLQQAENAPIEKWYPITVLKAAEKLKIVQLIRKGN